MSKSKANNIPSEIIHCPSITRAGMTKLMNLLFQLDICVCWGSLDEMYEIREGRLYTKKQHINWLGSWVPGLDNPNGLTFEGNQAIVMNHMIIPKFFTHKSLRLVRDARDMAISHYHRFRNSDNTSGCSNPFTLSEAINMPIPKDQGSLFFLGIVEEWILQELLINHFLPSEQIHSIYFEDLANKNCEAIAELLAFLGINRTKDDIVNALDIIDRKNYGDSNDHAEVGRFHQWQKPEYQIVQDRFDSLAYCLNAPHKYLVERKGLMPKITWPENVLLDSINIWISFQALQLRAAYSIVDISPFVPILQQMCLFSSEIPVLRLMLCRCLLHKNIHTELAKSEIEKLQANQPIFIKILATSALNSNTLDIKNSEISLKDEVNNLTSNAYKQGFLNNCFKLFADFEMYLRYL